MHKRLHCSCHQIQSYRFSFSANNWVQMAHTVATVILHYVPYENLDCPLEQVVINVLIFFLLKKAYRNRVNRLEKRVLAARGVVPLIYGEAPPERGTFFSLQVYKGVEVSLVDLKCMKG